MVMVGGGGDRNGSNIRTCATSAPKPSRHYCGKACTNILTSRAPPPPEISSCLQPKPRKCTTRKPSAAAAPTASASSSVTDSVCAALRELGRSAREFNSAPRQGNSGSAPGNSTTRRATGNSVCAAQRNSTPLSAKGAEYDSQGQARSASPLGNPQKRREALKERNNRAMIFRTFSALSKLSY